MCYLSSGIKLEYKREAIRIIRSLIVRFVFNKVSFDIYECFTSLRLHVRLTKETICLFFMRLSNMHAMNPFS